MDSLKKNTFLFLVALMWTRGDATGQVTFTNIGESSGTMLACNPHGSGFFDATGDGWDDVFIVENTSVGPYLHLPHVLFKNLATGLFTNIAAQAGVEGYLDISAQGLAAADYNNDGRIDLCIAMGSQGYQALLYRNKGDGTFTDVSYHVIPDQFTLFARCLTFLDYNMDGWLDLFFLVTSRSDVPGDRLFSLYRNEKDGGFANVTFQAGLSFPAYPDDLYGFAAGDVDNDLDTDVFVPRLTGASLFIVNDNGVFRDRTAASGLPNVPNCIGAVFLDYNNDGAFDLFVKRQNASPLLYRNDGDGTFTDVTGPSGLGAFSTGFLPTSSGFGGCCTAEDFDNDGNTDILVTNRHGNLNKLFRNRGDGTFGEIAGSAGLVEPYDYYWTTPVGDYNRDGYVDIFMARSAIDPADRRMHTALYRNDGGSNRSFSVRLAGVRSNRSGVGSRLAVYSGGRMQTRQVLGGDGYKVNSYWTHFGLGSAEYADSLVIRWPSGTVQRATEIPGGSFVTIEEKDTTLYMGPPYVAGTVSHSISGRVIPGVRVDLSGDVSGGGLTDGSGRYRVKPIPYGTATAVCTPGKTRGEDVGTGAVTAHDASMLLRYLAGLEIPSQDSRIAADADGNGILEALDAALIARYAVGLMDGPPSRAGQWSFDPGARTYHDVIRELEGQDYRAIVIGDASGNWGSGSSAGKTGTPPVFPDTVTAREGKRILEIPVHIGVNSGIQSMDIRLEYDASVLGFVDAAACEAASGFQFVYHSPAGGAVHAALFGAGPAPGAGRLMVFRFKPSGTRFASTTVDWIRLAINERPVSGGQTHVRIHGGDGSEPRGYELLHNAPNPFNSETVIRFDLERRDRVRLDVLDAMGRTVAVLADGWLNRGRHQLNWDGRDDRGLEAPSGMYISRLILSGGTQSVKMIKSR